MKTCKMMIGSTMVCLAVFAAGCDPVEDEALLSSSEQALVDAYACKGYSPFTGQSWVQTGKTEAEARKKAADFCYTKTGEVCVVQKCWETTWNPAESDGSGDWGCIAQEIVSTSPGGRTYTMTGATMQEARTAAIAYCHKKTARECMVIKCFPAD